MIFQAYSQTNVIYFVKTFYIKTPRVVYYVALLPNESKDRRPAPDSIRKSSITLFNLLNLSKTLTKRSGAVLIVGNQ
jgi:hypothetical protein